jgi:hypothetical protein
VIDMNDPSNGASPQEGTPASRSGLAEAITQHAQALVKANTNPNGMIGINPMQLFVDLELANVRIEVLFEALVDCGVDPKDLTVKLRDKLLGEVEQLSAAPTIEIARGNVPRNG